MPLLINAIELIKDSTVIKAYLAAELISLKLSISNRVLILVALIS